MATGSRCYHKRGAQTGVGLWKLPSRRSDGTGFPRERYNISPGIPSLSPSAPTAPSPGEPPEPSVNPQDPPLAIGVELLPNNFPAMGNHERKRFMGRGAGCNQPRLESKAQVGRMSGNRTISRGHRGPQAPVMPGGRSTARGQRRWFEPRARGLLTQRSPAVTSRSSPSLPLETFTKNSLNTSFIN